MDTNRTPFKIVLNPGRQLCGKMHRDVFINVQLRDGHLSITGVVGPMPSGNAYGSCGQIIVSNPRLVDQLAAGWTRSKVARLAAIWDRWHLNDMRAGTPAQAEHLRQHEAERGGDYYYWAKATLGAAGLDPDPATGYVYGTKWLSETIPAEIIDELRAFPPTKKTPAWV